MTLFNVRAGYLVVVAVIGLAWAGCSSPASRVAAHQGEFDAFPAAMQAKIRAGEVEIGFTSLQVRLALGDPDRVVTRTTATGASEVWVYDDKRPTFGFGFGLGMSTGGSTSMGAGVNTGSAGQNEKLRVVLVAGRVTALERAAK